MAQLECFDMHGVLVECVKKEVRYCSVDSSIVDMGGDIYKYPIMVYTRIVDLDPWCPFTRHDDFTQHEIKLFSYDSLSENNMPCIRTWTAPRSNINIGTIGVSIYCKDVMYTIFGPLKIVQVG